MSTTLRYPLLAILLLSVWTMLSADEGAAAEPYTWELQEVPDNADDISPAPLGAQLPNNLILRNLEGNEVNLLNAVAENDLTLLVFYRGGWCPFCTTQLAGLAQERQALLDAGVETIGISPDDYASLAESVEEMELQYTLLSDGTMRIITRFGLGFALDDDTIERYEEFGIPLKKNVWGQTALPVPALYLIDAQGVVRWTHIDPDFRERPDAAVVLEAVREHSSQDEE